MTSEELKRLQALPLEDKVTLTKLRIAEWYSHWNGQVCVSYSGGKDSTVLLHLAREFQPLIPAVYVNTGLEFPEVREQAINTPNTIVLKPEMNFREVLNKHGFVYPSKDVAYVIKCARRGSQWAINQMNGLDSKGNPDFYCEERYVKWKFLMESKFKISDECCNIMKEKPLKKFQRNYMLKPIIGTMASESRRRRRAYLKTGCNAYNSKYIRSAPISFWTEQDILQYIVTHNIKIPSIYGDIIKDKNGKYTTTGETRTGCMWCAIGANLEKVNRYQRMKETHPKIYDYCMNQLGMKEFLDFIGVKY